MKLNVLTVDSKKASSVEVSAVFEQSYNESLIHQAVVAYQANARQGTKKQKTRSEVSGGGRKPWRQKGTGRARAGTIRSPIWRSGGVTFAARADQNHSVRLNKKMYRAAMRSILSELVRQERLSVVESVVMEAPKTKKLVEVLNGYGLDTSANQNILIVTKGFDTNLYLSSRNVYRVDVCDVQNIDPVSLVASDKVLIAADAVKTIEEMLA